MDEVGWEYRVQDSLVGDGIVCVRWIYMDIRGSRDRVHTLSELFDSGMTVSRGKRQGIQFDDR